jgi:hypothetical protein
MKLEGHYARIMRLLSRGGALTDEDKNWLLLFISIQTRRTEHAIKEMRDWSARMADVVFRNHPEQRPPDPRTDEDLMKESMMLGIEFHDYVKDLKVTIFRNSTKIDYVICDHPAVITNRLHLQRLNENKFGISNSGLILIMPFTPRLCAVCYDGGVYTVPNASGTPFVVLSKDNDVRSINEFQYLNAGKNVYFPRWEDREDVAKEAGKVSEERSKATPNATVFVTDPTSPGSFRRGTPEEEAASRHEIVATSFLHPKPSSWPSQIRFKDKPTMYTNGSLKGYVRKPEWLRSRPRRTARLTFSKGGGVGGQKQF